MKTTPGTEHAQLSRGIGEANAARQDRRAKQGPNYP